MYRSEGLDLIGAEVAYILHHAQGLSLPLNVVAKVLYNMYLQEHASDLAAEEVAHCLSDANGLNLPVTHIAWILYNIDGLGLSTLRVLAALISQRGCNLSAGDALAAFEHMEGG